MWVVTWKLMFFSCLPLRLILYHPNCLLSLVKPLVFRCSYNTETCGSESWFTVHVGIISWFKFANRLFSSSAFCLWWADTKTSENLVLHCKSCLILKDGRLSVFGEGHALPLHDWLFFFLSSSSLVRILLSPTTTPQTHTLLTVNVKIQEWINGCYPLMCQDALRVVSSNWSREPRINVGCNCLTQGWVWDFIIINI